MRVLQLIDSLRAGGAERVAINIANALVDYTDKSFLCSTREEGSLRGEVNQKVHYFFLNRNRTLDLRAIFRLKHFVKKNDIDIIHAHASSFFIATVIKLMIPKVKLVWHDHLGKRFQKSGNDFFTLKQCSAFFDAIITVNQELEDWSKNNLKTPIVRYIPNFIVKSKIPAETKLKGINGKRILCLANLRNPKNHIFLIKAFHELLETKPDWSLHLVGKDYKDDYSKVLHDYINKHDLASKIYILGERKDVGHIIEQCDIGVLTSTNEGLPMALLEYGLGNLAVVVTDVGQCKDVVANFGSVIESGSNVDLIKSLMLFIKNKNLRDEKGTLFNNHVKQKYSVFGVINNIIKVYNS